MNTNKKTLISGIIKTWGTLLGFLLLLIVFSVLRPDVFPTGRNLRNIIEQVATLAIVASGVTVVMITGDLDLSVGAIASLVGVVAALLMKSGMGTFASILVAMALGTGAGLLNGLLIAYGGLSAFVGTLATMTAYGGVALLISKGTTIFALPENFRVLGQGSMGFLPISVLIMVLTVLVVALLLEQTTYGRRLYAIGGNEEASFLSGIRTRQVRLIAFGVSGFFASLGGIVLTSRLFSAHPQAGSPFMLNAAAAVFLGMTAFREGEANIWGTLLGVFIIGVMGNGLNILGINTYVQSILTGAIIIFAVLLSSLAKKRQR
ncbi:ABC transporter permease [Sphaerochaeta sp.]|jgi:ribose transport system permease protein|uniref:ABC transporter permease n=1 Tax=Sphaerochaeta sp. TaxID=1972642 RepID=UPI002A35932D|nr:ABC transporter permease [Sphaerochaeta sp.]MDX9985434.1 ABC transporter permease [Sphaerochaeta sp.]